MVNIKRQQNPKNSQKNVSIVLLLWSYVGYIVINVLHFCFELRALKMTSKIKHIIALFF